MKSSDQDKILTIKILDPGCILNSMLMNRFKESLAYLLLLRHSLTHLMPLLPMVTFPSGIIFFRTTPNISNRLSPLESAVHSHLLPKLVLYPVGDVERELFGLPVRFGGLGISNPTLTSDEQYTFSRELLHGLIDLICHQNPALSEDVVHHQHEIFRHLSSVKERSLSNQLQSTLSSCPPPLH